MARLPNNQFLKRCIFAMYPSDPKCAQRSFQARQAGIGLPATIFIIVILSLIVVAMSELNESSALGFGQDFNSMKSFYAAESGAQIALNRVFVGGAACNNALANIDFDAGGDNPGLNHCVSVLGCSQQDVAGVSYYTFSSEATCGFGFEASTRSIEVRAHDPVGP